MPHVMFGGLTHAPAERLAARLAALLPGDLNHVFFADSGSVAVEVAMKMAAQYWLNQGVRTRRRFLAFSGGYHGDTFATMAVCDPEEGMHALYRGLLAEHAIIALPRDADSAAAFDAFLDQHAAGLAGILVEPLVQGAGGMVFHDAAVLRHLRRAADAHGLPLIFDEIFTGFGRTGTMFACEAAGVVPDIITLSKALTGGTMALSAAVARDHIFAAFLSDGPGACADARPNLHGQPAGLRRGHGLAGPVRRRAAPGAGGGDRRADGARAGGLPRPAGRARRAGAGRHRCGRTGPASPTWTR